jgi:hypothetical protein
MQFALLAWVALAFVPIVVSDHVVRNRRFCFNPQRLRELFPVYRQKDAIGAGRNGLTAHPATAEAAALTAGRWTTSGLSSARLADGRLFWSSLSAAGLSGSAATLPTTSPRAGFALRTR